MNSVLSGLLGIATTIGLTTASQLVVKWQIMRLGGPKPGVDGAVRWALTLLLNPWIIAVLTAAGISILTWFFVVSRVPLSLAYPFVALTFPLVAISSALIFNEPIGWRSLAGLALIVAGVILNSLQGS